MTALKLTEHIKVCPSRLQGVAIRSLFLYPKEVNIDREPFISVKRNRRKTNATRRDSGWDKLFSWKTVGTEGEWYALFGFACAGII